MSGEYKNIIGYSPSDFFYVSALDSSSGLTIDCANIDLGNVYGNVYDSGNISGNISGNAKLYQNICLNQSLVKSWTDHKINHSGSSQALKDTQIHFNATVLNTVNLVIGIGFITWSLTSGWMYQ